MYKTGSFFIFFMLGTVQKLPLGWLVFEGGQRFCTKILRWRSFRGVADWAKILKKNCGGENWEGAEFAKKSQNTEKLWWRKLGGGGICRKKTQTTEKKHDFNKKCGIKSWTKIGWCKNLLGGGRKSQKKSEIPKNACFKKMG